jgi:DNA processing protein
MNGEPGAAAHSACAQCLRRSWLVAQLSGPLDCNCRADGRLVDLLALPDEQLIEALAGRRRIELRQRYARFTPEQLRGVDGIAQVCMHDPGYPPALHGSGAPATLFASCDPQRLSRVTARPVVALVGTARATDYGAEMARALGRGLAASGVTVAGELVGGIAQAAHEGASETGTSLAVLAGGMDVAPPAARRSLLGRIERDGAAVSESPSTTPRRQWNAAAAARIVAGLAEVTVAVEAEDSARELAGATVARALGRTVGAVPGRVTSRASRGCHALLRDGAVLIRGAGDVLDLLYGVERAHEQPHAVRDRLEPRLRSVLERVGAGLDTPQKLTAGAARPAELLQALSELELLGLLARGAGGRYVPCDAIDARV